MTLGRLYRALQESFSHLGTWHIHKFTFQRFCPGIVVSQIGLLGLTTVGLWPFVLIETGCAGLTTADGLCSVQELKIMPVDK